MKNLKMFCLSLEPKHYNFIKKLGYNPVGLGENFFSSDWFSDKEGDNISNKNKYYGEYTFHYWLWKNYLDKINDEWIGFCQYRKFWSFKNKNLFPNSLEELEETVIKEVPSDYDDFEVLLGEESSVANLKAMKFLKRGLKLLIKKPSYTFNLFSKKKRNIKFHFDMWHGSIYLEKAIELLDSENKKDFNDFVINSSSFNPHNMFICKSKKKLQEYYSVIFPWLKRCEDEFGFGNLKGYGETRIYGFLAERFMSYWFQKNSKFKTIPIVFYDIRKHSF
tara:strand:- start:3177 stop:4007 length:831 start_codon:yes stop_codon:yes gene_type:complete